MTQNCENELAVPIKDLYGRCEARRGDDRILACYPFWIAAAPRFLEWVIQYHGRLLSTYLENNMSVFFSTAGDRSCGDDGTTIDAMLFVFPWRGGEEERRCQRTGEHAKAFIEHFLVGCESVALERSIRKSRYEFVFVCEESLLRSGVKGK